MTDLRLATLRNIAVPVCAWTLHFIFVYAAVSAACGSRGLITFNMAIIGVAIATIAAVVAAGWHIFRPANADSDLGLAARWTAIISVAAILFDATPLIFLDSCR